MVFDGVTPLPTVALPLVWPSAPRPMPLAQLVSEITVAELAWTVAIPPTSTTALSRILAVVW